MIGLEWGEMGFSDTVITPGIARLDNRRVQTKSHNPSSPSMKMKIRQIWPEVNSSFMGHLFRDSSGSVKIGSRLLPPFEIYVGGRKVCTALG